MRMNQGEKKIHDAIIRRYNLGNKSPEDVVKLEKQARGNMDHLMRTIELYYNEGERKIARKTLVNICGSIIDEERARLKNGFHALLEEVRNYKFENYGLPSMPVLSKLAYEHLLKDLGPEPAPLIMGDTGFIKRKELSK